MRVLLDHSTWVPNYETPWLQSDDRKLKPVHSILRLAELTFPARALLKSSFDLTSLAFLFDSIPQKAGGHVIGKAGCIIKGIMEATNADLTVRNAIVDGFALIYFGCSTSEQQAQALAYIKRRVAIVDPGWVPETNYVSLS